MNLTEADLRRNYAGDLDAVLASQPQACQVQIPPSYEGGLELMVPYGEAKRPRKAAYTKGVPNETEKRFKRILDSGLWIEPISGYAFEPEDLQLSPDMTYRPDYKVILDSFDVDWIDVKGGGPVRDDSVCKAKAASVIIPPQYTVRHRFYIAQLKSGEWRIRQLGVVPRRTIKIEAR